VALDPQFGGDTHILGDSGESSDLPEIELHRDNYKSGMGVQKETTWIVLSVPCGNSEQ
jgi:hypothetical protein